VSGQDQLACLLREAAGGRFPPPDGAVEVLPSPAGPADAVVAFTAHHVVAASVDPGWVCRQLPEGDLGAAMRAPFLVRLGERLGARPGMVDVVMVAPPSIDGPGLELDPADGDHPRLARARRYRAGVRGFRDGRGGLVVIGTGLAGRWEVSVEVDEEARDRGLGTALARAAPRLVPAGEPLFAQVSPGNAASLRCFLAAGYRPIGAEVLFLRTGEGG
jgi:GNAT superfamily N-acetyltransferase